MRGKGSVVALGGDFGIPNPDGADFCAEDLASVERFASGDGVVEALVVDKLRLRSGQREVERRGGSDDVRRRTCA